MYSSILYNWQVNMMKIPCEFHFSFLLIRSLRKYVFATRGSSGLIKSRDQVLTVIPWEWVKRKVMEQQEMVSERRGILCFML